jgi:hypothetical protein
MSLPHFVQPVDIPPNDFTQQCPPLHDFDEQLLSSPLSCFAHGSFIAPDSAGADAGADDAGAPLQSSTDFEPASLFLLSGQLSQLDAYR